MQKLFALTVALLVPLVAHAGVSQEEADRLGADLTPVGAERAGNEDGSIPEFQGEAFWTEPQKTLTYEGLIDAMEKRDEVRMGNFAEQRPVSVITKGNYKQFEDKLTEGHKQMFELFDTYKMPLHDSVRNVFYPRQIEEATKKNAVTASLEGSDTVKDAELGFPFPIPGNGAEPIWNHKMKYRGQSARRFNNQAIVKRGGKFNISKLIEDVHFVYANLDKPGKASDNLLLMYLSEILEPPRNAGQLLLVHETSDQSQGSRSAWLYNPGLRRIRRAPNVAYDNPYEGTDGNQFNDQVDMFNGALDRYDWTLVGKKEIYIPYNSSAINESKYKYEEIIQDGHINQELARYELHRVWVVDAHIREGTSHQFGRRTFYIDEDSWSIAAVDCYDNRGELWKFQEGHLVTAPFVPTATAVPEVIYDFQSGRYFVTALVNEDKPSNWEQRFDENYFTTSTLKKKATR